MSSYNEIWSESSITWSSTSAFTGEAVEAFAVWDAWIELDFIQIDYFNAADIQVYDSDLTEPTLGVATYWVGSDGYIDRATIQLDVAEHPEYALPTLVHEIGHAIGHMSHHENPSSIMYPYVSSNFDRLSAQDIYEAQQAYGPDSGDNWLGGTAENDTILGGAGADTVFGHAGNDRIAGQDGDDLVYTGAGNDNISGGNDRDDLWGGSGRDRIDGGADADRLGGGEDGDVIYGSDGADTIYGGSGDDLIYAGSGDDLVFGGGGNDTIYGGDGHDVMYAGDGNDSVFGEAGNDTLGGGVGLDHLDGGAGINTIWDTDQDFSWTAAA